MFAPLLHYEVRALSSLPESDRAVLRKLCYATGWMRTELSRNVGYAVLAYRNHRIVGWTCLHKEYAPGSVERPSIRANIYVAPRYRRSKIGTSLMEKAVAASKRIWPHCEVLNARPHDEKGRQFFSRLPVGLLESKFEYRATLSLYPAEEINEPMYAPEVLSA